MHGLCQSETTRNAARRRTGEHVDESKLERKDQPVDTREERKTDRRRAGCQARCGRKAIIQNGCESRMGCEYGMGITNWLPKCESCMRVCGSEHTYDSVCY